MKKRMSCSKLLIFKKIKLVKANGNERFLKKKPLDFEGEKIEGEGFVWFIAIAISSILEIFLARQYFENLSYGFSEGATFMLFLMLFVLFFIILFIIFLFQSAEEGVKRYYETKRIVYDC